jgi:hypothetical protein
MEPIRVLAVHGAAAEKSISWQEGTIQAKAGIPYFLNPTPRDPIIPSTKPVS